MSGTFRTLLAAAIVALCIAASPAAFAQSSSTDATAMKKTYRDAARTSREKLDEKTRERQKRIAAKQQADMRMLELKRKKRDTCRKEATEKKLHLVKRQRFIRQCIKGV